MRISRDELDEARSAAETAAEAALMAKEIARALKDLGGEAHRRDVITAIARRKGHSPRHIPRPLEARILQIFDEMLRTGEPVDGHVFHLRFGPGSHRWGLRARGE